MKERFERLYREKKDVHGVSYNEHIIRDNKTGVLYYQSASRNGVSMTPLLGSDGKPIIEPVEK